MKMDMYLYIYMLRENGTCCCGEGPESCIVNQISGFL